MKMSEHYNSRVSNTLPAFGWILARFSSGARFTVPHNRINEQRHKASCRSGRSGMGGDLLSEALSCAPDRATLMVLLAAMPVAIALYFNCRSRAGRLRPAFSLGKLEAIECERAMLLYKKAARR